MDEEIKKLERQLKLYPRNIFILKKIERLYRRSNRKDDAIKTRIWLRVCENEISEERVCAATSLGFKIAQDICKKEKINPAWNYECIMSVL